MGERGEVRPEVDLSPQALEALSRRVVELLCERRVGGVAHLLDVRELAEVLGVRPRWVHEHASELGAIRLGKGPRAQPAFRCRRGARTAATTPRWGRPERLAFCAAQSYGPRAPKIAIAPPSEGFRAGSRPRSAHAMSFPVCGSADRCRDGSTDEEEDKDG